MMDAECATKTIFFFQKEKIKNFTDFRTNHTLSTMSSNTTTDTNTSTTATAATDDAAKFVFRVPAQKLAMEAGGKCKACSKIGLRRAFQSHLPGVTNEVYLLAFCCDECGYNEAEIKRDGFSKIGRCYELTVTTPHDLKRPLLHSPSATIKFPAIDMEFEGGFTSGVFHTVETFVNGIADDLRSHAQVISSNTNDRQTQKNLNNFLKKLEKLKSKSSMPWKFSIRDPLNLSYIATKGSTLADDPQLNVLDFERSDDENYRYQVELDDIDENTPTVDDIDEIAHNMEMVEVSTVHERIKHRNAASASVKGGSNSSTTTNTSADQVDNADDDDDDDDLPDLIAPVANNAPARIIAGENKD